MRRRLLVLLLGGVVLLPGCTSGAETEPAAVAVPDDLAVTRTVDDTRHLRDDALTVAGDNPQDAAVLRRIAADHDAALVALGSSSSPAAPTASPAATPQAGATVSRQLSGEWAAARNALRDGLAADDDGLAVLLVRIAATRAAHADRLARLADRADLPALRPAAAEATPATATPDASAGPTSSVPVGDVTPFATASGDPGLPTPTPSAAAPDTDAERALDRLLAGEHAAVFAYPALLPRLSGADRDRAEELWADHRTARNELTARLLSAGVEPTVPAPAYDVGAVTGAADARKLAGRIETGITQLAADVVGTAADGADRRYGADELVLAARRAARWTGRAVPLPQGATPTTAPTS